MKDTITYIAKAVLPAAFDLLPEGMRKAEAAAMLLAIGLQESQFSARRQLPDGPARGFWQFERMGGVNGILTHDITGPIIHDICGMLEYAPGSLTCHAAIEHNDILAACFARLLLWTDSRVMPRESQADKGWQIYLATWRPGKPRPLAWPENFMVAWSIIINRSVVNRLTNRLY